MAQFVQGNIGTSADLPFAGPSTIVGATGQYLEFVNYIQQAYKTLQLDQKNWKFRTKPFQLTLVAGQNFYTLAQIRSQIPDWEEIIHMHFIDDSQYGLVAQSQTAPAATTTASAVTQLSDTYFVTLTAITGYNTFQPVLITDGTNSIAGPIQSINGSIISFAVESVTVGGTATSIALHSPVTYTGTYKPPNVANQTFCFFIEYQNWRGWKDRNVLPNGKPTYYTRTPDRSLEFNPVPDVTTAPYIFYNDYRSKIDVLNTSSNSSTPLYLPDQFHEAICWRSIMYWAMVRNKPDKYTAAKLEYDRIMTQAYLDNIPTIEPYLRELYG